MKKGITRRDLLRTGIALGAGGLAACAGPLRTTANRALLAMTPVPAPGRVAFALERGGEMRALCERLIPRITDLSWLSPGDSVLVKVACNSGERHPAVTSPEAVRAVVGFLRDRGAGKVLVGDQSGVEHVRLTASERRSSTRELMARNGLLEAIESSGATLCAFDDQGWDGYFQPTADFPNHWEQAPWLPRILQKVDHVVNLPRLGTHAVAGYTCGIKVAVGWLRDDSRLLLHQRADSFFEKIAELNRFPPLRDKLRFTLTLGTHALLNVGPDMGAEYDFGGTLAMASQNLVDHDQLATALLPWLDDDDASFYDLYAPYPEHSDYWNRGFVEETWGEEALSDYRPLTPPDYTRGLEYDACASHLATLEGRRPSRIELLVDGPLPPGLVEHLKTLRGGLFVV